MADEMERCDTCGEPATQWCIDVFRHEVPGAMWVECSPVPNSVKYGCDAHPVESETFRTQLPSHRAARGR